MSGEELALKVGYKTQSGISNLENRSNGHGGNNITKIAEALNVSVEWLLRGPDTHDMLTVKPYDTTDNPPPPAPLPPTPVVREQLSEWPTLHEKAHALIDRTSERGLANMMEMFEMLAKTHPRSDDSAGVPVPARRAHGV
jgi:transcriptional regulator with XRE-family HTH domain